MPLFCVRNPLTSDAMNTVKLLAKSASAGCAAKIPPAELAGVLQALPPDPFAKDRLLSSTGCNEDAAILRLPDGKALVQTVDFFPPVVNDPYSFGQIAAANALSDVYAMGGEPWCAMNLVCFPIREMPREVLSAILEGGAAKLAEAGAAQAGGHSVDDPQIKYGLAVSGLVEQNAFASNDRLAPGDALVLTKPLGTGILATAIKAEWQDYESTERVLVATAARLNAGPARVVRRLGLRAATDVTGFGLGGHLLEMAVASFAGIRLEAAALPALPGALELAGMGFVPAGCHANKQHRKAQTRVAPGVDPLLVDLAFDPQTSGGIVLAVPPQKLPDALAMLRDSGDDARVVGEVLPCRDQPVLLME